MAKSKAPEAEFRLIGPQDAEEMLTHNTRNRRLRRRDIEKYARDMKLGRWMSTGDAIRFAHDGTLLDGQHRLYACIEAQCGFFSLVLKNVGGQSIMDTGIRRTFADHLAILGVSHYFAVASAVRMVAASEMTKPHDVDPGLRTVVTMLDHKETFEKRPKVFEETVRESYRYYGASEKLISPGMMSGLYILFRKHDKEAADWYRLRLYDGVGLKSEDPAWLVRRAFVTQGPNSRLTQRQKLALLIMGFNATARGEEVEHLRFISTGPRKQAFPRVGVST